MCGHDHLKCKKCGKYTDFANARAYGSLPCNCIFIANRRHEEIIQAIKSLHNQPERSKREDLTSISEPSEECKKAMVKMFWS
jgi:hypothetical protein